MRAKGANMMEVEGLGVGGGMTLRGKERKGWAGVVMGN